MKFPRRSRILGALLALVSTLFMQLVLAGYVCPASAAMVGRSATMHVGGDTVRMAGCEQMDMEQPSLCHANAHSLQQSLDKHELPALHAFVPSSLTSVWPDTAFQSFRPPAGSPSILLSGAPAPPLAIRHCCFRI